MVLAGLIYRRGKRLPYVDVAEIVAELKKIARALRWFGLGAMILGVVGIVWVWGPLAVLNLNYQLPITKEFPITKSQDSNWVVPDQDYSIYIPKIGAVSKVILNVDAGNKKEYLGVLKLGVAEAAGLAHPGEKGTTFLFAHSVASPVDFARYNAVFYLLDKLEEGDEVQIVYKNKLLRYEVETREILDARNTKYLKNSDSEMLVLQTCWPAGTTAKRLVLTARPVMVY